MGKKDKESYQCPVCSVVIYKANEFERHVFRKHGQHVKAEKFLVQEQPPAPATPPVPVPANTSRLSA